MLAKRLIHAFNYSSKAADKVVDLSVLPRIEKGHSAA